MSAWTLEELASIVNSNDPATMAAPMQLFAKIAANVLNNPTDEKFRKLNKEKVLPKLTADGQVQGMEMLLETVGFIENSEHTHFELAMGADLSLLRQSAAMLAPVEHPATQRDAAYAARKAKADAILARNQALANQIKAKKAKDREQLAKKLCATKASAKDKPVMASVAVNRTFGATLKVFEPPPPAAKGGGGG